LKQIYDITTASQSICVGAIAVLIMYFPVILQSSENYTRNRKLERPDYDHEDLYDFWMIVPITIVLRFIKSLFHKALENYFKSILSSKYTGEILEKKTMVSCKGVFKIFYFSCSAFIGYLVAKETNFASPSMLCEGSSDLINGNWPFTMMPKLMKFHYML
jgi:hypothetical protein